MWTLGEYTNVILQTELSRSASGQAAQCESTSWPGSATQEQGITVIASRSISGPAFGSGRASPASACFAHPLHTPRQAAGLQEPLRAERGPAVKCQRKETPAPGVSQHSIPAFAPLVFWLQTGHVITTWGPSWLLCGKSRRPLLLDRPSQALLWIKDKASSP